MASKKWNYNSLTEKEYKQIIDIWKKYYEIPGDGDKKYYYDVRWGFLAMISIPCEYGLEELSKDTVSLEDVYKVRKDLDIKIAEEKEKKGIEERFTGIHDDGVANELIWYCTIASLRVIGFDKEKYIDLCLVTRGFSRKLN